MMAASVLLVTHSSSLVTPSGRAPRHRCRGSIFLFTSGMLPASPHASAGQRRKKGEKKKRKYTNFAVCLFFLPIFSALCPAGSSFPHRDTEDAAGVAAAGLFCAGDAPWVQTSSCRGVHGCKDRGEDHAGAPSPPLSPLRSHRARGTLSHLPSRSSALKPGANPHVLQPFGRPRKASSNPKGRPEASKRL